MKMFSNLFQYGEAWGSSLFLDLTQIRLGDPNRFSKVALRDFFWFSDFFDNGTETSRLFVHVICYIICYVKNI